MFRENVIRRVVGGTNAEVPLNYHVYFVKSIFLIEWFGLNGTIHVCNFKHCRGHH
jgi:hypothetical protein